MKGWGFIYLSLLEVISLCRNKYNKGQQREKDVEIVNKRLMEKSVIKFKLSYKRSLCKQLRIMVKSLQVSFVQMAVLCRNH